MMRNNKVEIAFISASLPDMDAISLLSQVRREDLNVLVIIVTDQLDAKVRSQCIETGALDVIEKPLSKERLNQLLNDYGILQLTEQHTHGNNLQLEEQVADFYHELAQASIGKGTYILSKLLNVDIPSSQAAVRQLSITELIKMLNSIQVSDDIIPICQGFIGAGVAGEIMLIFNRPNPQDLADLMNFNDEITDSLQTEFVMDIASVLSGACLSGLTEQLDIAFSLGHPRVLGEHLSFRELTHYKNKHPWDTTIAFETRIKLESHHLNCHLMLLLTEESVDKVNHLVSYIS